MKRLKGWQAGLVVLGAIWGLAGIVWVVGKATNHPEPVAEWTAPSTATSSAAAASSAPVTDAPSTAVASTPAPSPTVSDNPAFDLTGSGSDCVMTYRPSQSGGTLTVVTVDVPGEIITHVSGPDGIHRNDVEITQGPNAFTYDVPLSQVGDMGAVFYLENGTSQSCTIKPAE